MAAFFAADLDKKRFPVKADKLYYHCICRIGPRRQTDVLEWIVACPDRFLHVKLKIALWVISWLGPESVVVSVTEVNLFHLLESALDIFGRDRCPQFDQDQ